MIILNKKCNHMAGKCSLQSTALAMATRKSWSHCCCHSPSAKKITQRQNFPFYLLLNRQKLSHLAFPTWWANEQNFQFKTSVYVHMFHHFMAQKENKHCYLHEQMLLSYFFQVILSPSQEKTAYQLFLTLHADDDAAITTARKMKSFWFDVSGLSYYQNLTSF